MRKRKLFLLCVSMFVLGLTGCTTTSNGDITPTVATQSSQKDVTPTSVIESTDITITPKPTTSAFKENNTGKTTVSPTPSKTVIAKTDGLCEQLEQVELSVEVYNSVNQMLSVDASIGVNGKSSFCIDETTGVVYFVNEGNDGFLYRIKEGEVALALAMPVKELYPYQGSIYFMLDDCYGKYEFQDMKSGDIYCYTPASGAVEFVYAASVIENSQKHEMLVDERGIYFSYSVETGKNSSTTFYAYLPFGATEHVQDMNYGASKGWKDYVFGYEYTPELKLVLSNRVENADGIRERIVLSASPAYFCVIGDILYSAEKRHIACMNLVTQETTMYDFSEAIEQYDPIALVEPNNRFIEWFTITEDAIWITTGARLYRMDIQSGEITHADIFHNNNLYSVHMLYTDGKQVYGVNTPMKFVSTAERTFVRILTEDMDNSANGRIGVEFLME